MDCYLNVQKMNLFFSPSCTFTQFLFTPSAFLSSSTFLRLFYSGKYLIYFSSFENLNSKASNCVKRERVRRRHGEVINALGAEGGGESWQT